jgi:hypothetical protein
VLPSAEDPDAYGTNHQQPRCVIPKEYLAQVLGGLVAVLLAGTCNPSLAYCRGCCLLQRPRFLLGAAIGPKNAGTEKA